MGRQRGRGWRRQGFRSMTPFFCFARGWTGRKALGLGTGDVCPGDCEGRWMDGCSSLFLVYGHPYRVFVWAEQAAFALGSPQQFPSQAHVPSGPNSNTHATNTASLACWHVYSSFVLCVFLLIFQIPPPRFRPHFSFFIPLLLHACIIGPRMVGRIASCAFLRPLLHARLSLSALFLREWSLQYEFLPTYLCCCVAGGWM